MICAGGLLQSAADDVPSGYVIENDFLHNRIVRTHTVRRYLQVVVVVYRMISNVILSL